MNAGLSYRQAQALGASPIRLVILLYEQAIEDLRRAVDAQAQRDIERRTREINHAVLVIGHLQATLDKVQGGNVAKNLDVFYHRVRAALVEAQCQQSIPLIEQQISHLMQVHQAWCDVERVENAAPPQPPESANNTGHWSA